MLVVIIVSPTQKTNPSTTAEIARAGRARAQKLRIYTPYTSAAEISAVERQSKKAFTLW